jgi:hypothetical protein
MIPDVHKLRELIDTYKALLSTARDPIRQAWLRGLIRSAVAMLEKA